PGSSGLDHPAPAVLLELAASGAALADYRERELVRRLVLVQTVTRQDRTMTGQQMDRVLDSDAFEHLVGGVGDQPVHRPEQPLASVGDMGKRVLDGAASRGPIGVVDAAVSR